MPLDEFANCSSDDGVDGAGAEAVATPRLRDAQFANCSSDDGVDGAGAEAAATPRPREARCADSSSDDAVNDDGVDGDGAEEGQAEASPTSARPDAWRGVADGCAPRGSPAAGSCRSHAGVSPLGSLREAVDEDEGGVTFGTRDADFGRGAVRRLGFCEEAGDDDADAGAGDFPEYDEVRLLWRMDSALAARFAQRLRALERGKEQALQRAEALETEAAETEAEADAVEEACEARSRQRQRSLALRLLAGAVVPALAIVAAAAVRGPLSAPHAAARLRDSDEVRPAVEEMLSSLAERIRPGDGPRTAHSAAVVADAALKGAERSAPCEGADAAAASLDRGACVAEVRAMDDEAEDLDAVLERDILGYQQMIAAMVDWVSAAQEQAPGAWAAMANCLAAARSAYRISATRLNATLLGEHDLARGLRRALRAERRAYLMADEGAISGDVEADMRSFGTNDVELRAFVPLLRPVVTPVATAR